MKYTLPKTSVSYFQSIEINSFKIYCKIRAIKETITYKRDSSNTIINFMKNFVDSYGGIYQSTIFNNKKQSYITKIELVCEQMIINEQIMKYHAPIIIFDFRQDLVDFLTEYNPWFFVPFTILEEFKELLLLESEDNEKFAEILKKIDYIKQQEYTNDLIKQKVELESLYKQKQNMIDEFITNKQKFSFNTYQAHAQRMYQSIRPVICHPNKYTELFSQCNYTYTLPVASQVTSLLNAKIYVYSHSFENDNYTYNEVPLNQKDIQTFFDHKNIFSVISNFYQQFKEHLNAFILSKGRSITTPLILFHFYKFIFDNAAQIPNLILAILKEIIKIDIEIKSTLYSLFEKEFEQFFDLYIEKIMYNKLSKLTFADNYQKYRYRFLLSIKERLLNNIFVIPLPNDTNVMIKVLHVEEEEDQIILTCK